MCKTIKQKVKFKAGPQSVYELLTDSKKQSAFSGQKAKLAKESAGHFLLTQDRFGESMWISSKACGWFKHGGLVSSSGHFLNGGGRARSDT